jgi:hypothetical protein
MDIATPGRWLGRGLARYLSQRSHAHLAAPAVPASTLLAALQPGDVLLVEGQTRYSVAIKYLTQSTWSHAALYVGEDARLSAPGHGFVEADINDGVRSIGIDQYLDHNVRICRPSGLDANERAAVIAYAISRLGDQYDLRNVFDLARYLLPTPPVPIAFRRRMLALGSSDPTRAICSTLIAQAFQSVGYPILPLIESRDAQTPDCPGCIEEILHIRHYSLFAPRDFDVSPFFQVLKPGIDTLCHLRTSKAAA